MARAVACATTISAIVITARRAAAEEPAPAPPVAPAVSEVPRPVVREAVAPAPVPLFGRQGHVVLDLMRVNAVSSAFGQDLGVAAGWLSVSTTQIDVDRIDAAALRMTTVSLAPSLDVFVSDRLTIGGSVHVSYQRARASSSGPERDRAGAGVAPRIGWVIPVADGLWLWPRVHGAFRVQAGPAAGDEPTWAVGAHGGIVAALSRHVVFDVGPRLEYTREDTNGLLAYGPTPDTTQTSFSVGLTSALSLVF